MPTLSLRGAAFALLLPALSLPAQTPSTAAPTSLQALSFLEGSWSAQGTGQGATAHGSYSFVRELDGHVLARHTRAANCKGPITFDCEHGDLLYIFQDAPGQALKALYLDSEGHTLHYNVTTPDPQTVVFLSEGSGGGPVFRLTYQRKAGIMQGKFQMQRPGQSTWNSYLEWTGEKQ